MGAGIAGHWWLILIIVVLLFGAPKLPALARSVGQSLKIFKSEIKSNDDTTTTSSTVDATDSVSSTKAGDTTSKP